MKLILATNIGLVKYNFLYIIIILSGVLYPSQLSGQIKFDINIPDYINREEKVKLSSVVRNIEYIVLETTPECLLDKDYKIELTNEYIFIFDYLNLYRFSNTGKFLNKIGRMGRGPGEYLRLGADFAVDDVKKEVYLLDFFGNKILVHQYDGTYLREIKLQFSGQFMSLLSNNHLVHHNIGYTYFSRNEDTYELEILDTQGKGINRLKSTLSENRRYGMILIFPFFYHFNNKTLYKNPFNDTVYNLTINNYEPYGIVSSGKFARDSRHDDFQKGGYNTDEKSIIVTGMAESQRYLFISYVRGSGQRLLFDKNTNKSVHVVTGLKNLIEEGRETSYTKGLVNDIDGGFPFWPQKIVNDSILIDIRYAHEFKLLDESWFSNKEILYQNRSDNLKEITKKINQFDNPILIIAK